MKDIATFGLFGEQKRRLFIRRISASRGKPQRYGIYNRTANGIEQLFSEAIEYKTAKELLLKLRRELAH